MTEAEQVEAYVFPSGLSAVEKKAADAEMRAIRLKSLEEMTEEQRLLAELLRLKYQMEDYFREKDKAPGRRPGKK